MLFTATQLKEIGAIKETSARIAVLLFTAALKENPSWQKHFKDNINNPASYENIVKMTGFVDSFIKPHLLDGIEPAARVELFRNIGVKIFKKEIEHLSGASGGALKRNIRIHASRGWLAEFVGYYSDECWTRTSNIIRDNPDTIALIFSDEESGEILGGTLLMPCSVNGKKAIIDRGLSPRSEVTADLSTEDFVRQVVDYEQEIAARLGAEMILVPLRSLEVGLGTNNPDIIQYYEKAFSGRAPVNLDIPNTFNGHDITNGKCVVIREFPLSSPAAAPDAAPAPTAEAISRSISSGRQGTQIYYEHPGQCVEFSG